MTEYKPLSPLLQTMSALELLGYLGIAVLVIVAHLFFWAETARLLYKSRSDPHDLNGTKAECLFFGFFWPIALPIALCAKIAWYLAFGKDNDTGKPTP